MEGRGLSSAGLAQAWWEGEKSSWVQCQEVQFPPPLPSIPSTPAAPTTATTLPAQPPQAPQVHSHPCDSLGSSSAGHWQQSPMTHTWASQGVLLAPGHQTPVQPLNVLTWLKVAMACSDLWWIRAMVLNTGGKEQSWGAENKNKFIISFHPTAKLPQRWGIWAFIGVKVCMGGEYVFVLLTPGCCRISPWVWRLQVPQQLLSHRASSARGHWPRLVHSHSTVGKALGPPAKASQQVFAQLGATSAPVSAQGLLNPSSF